MAELDGTRYIFIPFIEVHAVFCFRGEFIRDSSVAKRTLVVAHILLFLFLHFDVAVAVDIHFVVHNSHHTRVFHLKRDAIPGVRRDKESQSRA